MSPYELFATITACLAVIVSLITWNGQRKLQREANDLQRATSKLAEKQLELLLKEERGKSIARLSLNLVRDGKNYKFCLTNIGEAEALNAEIRLILQRQDDNPIISSEYSEKFPAKKIMPGSSVTLIAAIHLGSPSAYNAVLSWSNPDGSRIEEEAYVTL
ncbi:hypothetical protein NA655_10695 [Pseudomonas kuykendallii]|uniref:Uncharacterized protein n=1 Tax=Pseudomonas kuykendallii TaxID=1007099 RepID=A0A1H2ZFH3_9PSED|nr:hypothetical protein [Pseudomonas kuykendallii]MCQ4271487.1 hypothetical protein [Pseudomonas kuykendallii]SDX16126.1 hypothetical protein SAMN05216287_2282 [Pseudomonas kuykendallii]